MKTEFRHMDHSTQTLERPRDTHVHSRATLLTQRAYKDSRLSWIVCGAVIVTQILILGVLHAFGIFFVVLTHEFASTKANVGLYQIYYCQNYKSIHNTVVTMTLITLLRCHGGNVIIWR